MASQPLPANDGHDTLSDMDAECAVLSQMLCENDCIDDVADIITADDFSVPALRRIYEAALHQFGQGKAANPVTLRPLLEGDVGLQQLGGTAFLAELTGNMGAMLYPVKETAKQIADIGRRRRMRATLEGAVLQCSDLTAPISSVVELADQALSPVAAGNVRDTTAAQCLRGYVAALDEERHGVVCQHIPAIDELHGPMEPSQLIIMAGRPGMGKTAVALSYVLGAAQAGHGVLFASLEMNGEQLAGRMLADLCFDGSQVPYSAIRDRKLNDFQRRKVTEAAERSAALPIQIVDAGSLSPNRLAMIARRTDRRFRAKGGSLDLIVVDYLQLLRPDSGTAKPYEAVSEISRALKGMAKDLGVPVLALAQLSRSVETRPDRRPQLSDLRDSGQIEQDADSVLFLLREEYYLHQAEPDEMDPKRAQWEMAMEQSRGRIEFILAKRRNGMAGSAFGAFHGAYQAVR